jgi:hypothetical protein
MTAQAPTQTAPSPADTRERTALVVVGSVIAGLGSLVAIAGIALLVVFGTDGRLSSGRHRIDTPAAALVSGTARIKDTTDAAAVLGTTSIQLSAQARGEHGVFVGVARRVDVDRYLAGAAVDEVTDFDVDPFRLSRTTRSGTATPAPPADQSFWVARSTGDRSAAIDWTVRDGAYRVVVMNADGTDGVATASTIGVTIENLSDIAWTLIVIGLIVGAGGTAALVLALRRR